MLDEAITITFSERVENHAGMQMIGELAPVGFTRRDLHKTMQTFKNKNYKCNLYCLSNPSGDESEDGYILVIKKGTMAFDIDPDNLWHELRPLTWDTKAKMRGRVVNKHARYNLCFSDFNQDPDYEAGKGRIVSFSQLPRLNKIKQQLPDYFGKKASDLKAEGNYYYNNQTGIGFHGDTERRIVIAIRLGKFRL